MITFKDRSETSAGDPVPRVVATAKFEIGMPVRHRKYGFRGVIFDRHPVVSQPIYGRFRRNTEVDKELAVRFYDSRPLLIYCRGRSLEGHVEKDHDTSEHMASVNLNHDAMCRHYDEWAKDHAHVWYRVGDSMERIVNLVLGAIKGD